MDVALHHDPFLFRLVQPDAHNGVDHDVFAVGRLRELVGLLDQPLDILLRLLRSLLSAREAEKAEEYISCFLWRESSSTRMIVS